MLPLILSCLNPGGQMRYIVILRIREAIVGETVPSAQQTVEAVMQKLLGSGKVTHSGVFVDDRAGRPRTSSLEAGSRHQSMGSLSVATVGRRQAADANRRRAAAPRRQGTLRGNLPHGSEVPRGPFPLRSATFDGSPRCPTGDADFGKQNPSFN